MPTRLQGRLRAGFFAGQLQLVPNDEKDLTVGISAHGIKRVIAAGFSLKDGEIGFKASLQLAEHLLPLLGTEKVQQAAALGAGLLYSVG